MEAELPKFGGSILLSVQIDVNFSCVCPVIDHEFRYNIVKEAVDRRVDPQAYELIHCR